MKIIEALKQVKDLNRKAEDLRDKISKHSAHRDIENPVYEDQKKQVREWLQSHSDILKEILRLKIAIQKTNLLTDVTIELDGKQVTKSITEWIIRRVSLADQERKAWAQLTDRGLNDLKIKESTGSEREVKVVRCYDPEERDKNIELYTSEPSLIDGRLEVVNAVTDLIE